MREVTAQAYEKGRNSADAKTILLLPPTGGENPLDRNMAGFLCGLGFRVVVVRGWKYDDEVSVEDFGFHDRQSIRMAAALRHVVEYINPTRPKQLGVLGTSLGGIRASFLLGIEPRVAAGVLIVAGGGMPEISSSSTEEGLTKLREARMARFSFASVDNYQAELSRHIKIDALDFIGSSGEKNVLMVIAGNDTTVPTQSQLRLHQAFGSQDRIDYSGNHLEAIVAAFSLNGLRFASFFNSNLD
jgi:dienelactone hydrolase